MGIFNNKLILTAISLISLVLIMLYYVFLPGDVEIMEVAEIQPEFRGSSKLCRSPTKSMKCPNETCIKISAVGLCGGWSKNLRALPAAFQCPQRNDTIVLEHTDKPETISGSDIVLFTFMARYINMDVWLELRRYRPQNQMWVLQSEESPFYAVGYLPPWMYRLDTFNISNTYHTKADVSSPYGYYEPHRNDEFIESIDFSEFYRNKSKFMIWIGSHCETLQWDRTKFIADLREVMDVDMFGKCGNNTLCQNRWENDCIKKMDDLVGSYKFYLAIENSCCEDYLTEKLWHAYTLGTIPVVLGPRIENYMELVPPHSFIHIDQFDSAEHLRDYLEYLSKNSTAYLEYFQWRNEGVVNEHSMGEHYKNHLSDKVLCSIVDQYVLREASPSKVTKMFDPYGPEWRGTCHRCGDHQWIRNYEYALDHKRKSKSLWAK